MFSYVQPFLSPKTENINNLKNYPQNGVYGEMELEKKSL